MPAYLCLVLHAHLPFVRQPEDERCIEETWLLEAITETYLPLLQCLHGWQRDALPVKLSLTLSPTLCSMLRDPLLRQRYARHLDERIELASKEIRRTHWEKPFQELARFYHQRFTALRATCLECGGDLVGAFAKLQDAGRLEIITCSATHAVLPLLANDPPSLRAQLLVARDHYQACFGRPPRGIWLPECAYSEALDPFLVEAGLRWFVLDTHGVLRARPQPQYAVFAPILTPAGLAVFGRDPDSARQVWSRGEGYPGDPRYRDFYRDIGFDLDLDYLKPYLPGAGLRAFTGLKYHRITGPGPGKSLYDRSAAMQATKDHAGHFLAARRAQLELLEGKLDRPPLFVSPYDAELFGHWWYEGPEFLDVLVREACAGGEFEWITPLEYLRRHPTNQQAVPAASSWGEEGYWRVWLNEKNEWVYPHLQAAQQRMGELVRRFPQPDALQVRALRQAGRELLLAQASDWPFILRTGTSPGYARQRLQEHLLRFSLLNEQLLGAGLDQALLQRFESHDNPFPDLDYRYWARD